MAQTEVTVTHRKHRLVLLGSPSDTVHGFQSHRLGLHRRINTFFNINDKYYIQIVTTNYYNIFFVKYQVIFEKKLKIILLYYLQESNIPHSNIL